MPPRPLHCWKSFWLGLLVLIFLGWAWVLSTDGWDYIFFSAAYFSSSGVGSNGPGGLSLGWTDDPFLPDGLSIFSHQGGPIHNWFPEAFTLAGTTAEGWPMEGVTIAHWFLILLFLVPWAGFLYWRVRRMRRAGEMRPPVEDRAHR